MSAPVLHNPLSQAHLDDLEDRVAGALRRRAPDPRAPLRPEAVAATLASVVRAMERGALPPSQAAQLFATFNLGAFDFDRWLAEMVDEGVYLAPRARAA